MKNLNLKKNQVVIFVIALMLVTAGYLNFTNKQNAEQDLIPTSTLADSEQMAAIGDAKLVSANQTTNNSITNSEQSNIRNSNEIENSTTNVVENNTDNVTNNLEKTNTSIADLDNNYFAQSRLDRDNMYSQMLENYQKMLETDNLNAEEKTDAQEEIKRINNEKNAIMIAENLIKTKGFEDVILFVNNGNVSVIIKAETLDENQVAQIQNIITRELAVQVTKINVSIQ